MKRVVVTNVFGPLNRGDHELVQSLLNSLGDRAELRGIAREPDLCAQFFPDADWLAQPGRHDDSIGPIPATAVRLGLTIVFLAAMRIPAMTRLLPGDQRRSARALRSCDLVIACPGGYLHDDSLSFYLQVSQLLAARIAGRPLIVAPMSVGPLRSAQSKWLTKRALGGADRIYVRDQESLEMCKTLGLSAQLHVDLAVEDRMDEGEGGLEGGRYVLCTLLRFGFPDADDVAAAKQLYEDRVTAVLGELGDEGYLVKLMVQVDGDLEVIDRVAKRLGGAGEVVYPRSPDECRDLMRGAAGVVASRLHSGIFALQVGTPVVFLGYQPKSVGVLRTLGLADLERPLTDFEPRELTEQLRLLMKDRAAFALRVRSAIRELPEEMREFESVARAALER